MKAIIGRKIGMTQIIDDEGRAIAVTLLQAGPCTVTQVRNDESDGYSAVQLGFEEAKKLTKSLKGHLKKAKANSKVIREFRLEPSEVKLGDQIKVTNFELGDLVDVQSVSKGKGFAGTVKRHNFRTSKKSHGGKGSIREPGSIGSMYPQKIFKGKKMAGQMGSVTKTIKNQRIAFIDDENNLIGIEGNVPGAKKSIVKIKAVK